MSKFGRQPAADVIKRHGISRRRVAEAAGVSGIALNNTLAGNQLPSHEMRERLPEVLGAPAARLFTAEALAREPRKKYRRGSVVTAGDDASIRWKRYDDRHDLEAQTNTSSVR